MNSYYDSDLVDPNNKSNIEPLTQDNSYQYLNEMRLKDQQIESIQQELYDIKTNKLKYLGDTIWALKSDLEQKNK